MTNEAPLENGRCGDSIRYDTGCQGHRRVGGADARDAPRGNPGATGRYDPWERSAGSA